MKQLYLVKRRTLGLLKLVSLSAFFRFDVTGVEPENVRETRGSLFRRDERQKQVELTVLVSGTRLKK